MDGPVIGVLGGSGGVGASAVAAVLAYVTGALLIDLDAMSGGIDVLLSAEDAPGARWSGLRLAGGRLDPDVFADALPRWESVPFLAADVMPEPGPARQAVEVAREHGPAVVDLPRWPGPVRDAALPACDLAVLVTAADVRAVSAARAVARSLPDVPLGVLVRAGRGCAPPARVAQVVGAPLLGTAGLPATRRDEPLRASALPKALVRVCHGIWQGVGVSHG